MSEDIHSGRALPLMEVFWSLQGEGFHTGESAIFLRIGGCDVGCRWCDVKESWDPGLHPLTNTDDIIARVRNFSSPNIVVTGGEPALYQLDYLCNRLHQLGYKTFLETSGSEPLSGKWDWICLSPKKNAPVSDDICLQADELKLIIESPDDLVWAEQNAIRVRPECRLFLQPEWSCRQQAVPLIVDYIEKNPKWKLSLQMHKYIGIP